MGVLGLSSYFESRSLGQRRNWSSPPATQLSHADPTEATPHSKDSTSSGSSKENDLTPTEKNLRYFIIDGNAYIHHLYCGQFEWIWGGQYSSFVNLLTAHVAALRSCGFQLQFLFDGPLPNQKRQTRLTRDTEKIRKITKVISNLENNHVIGLNSNHSNNLTNPSDSMAALGRIGGTGTVTSGSQSNFYFLIPPLVLEITLQTLRSLGADLMVCDGEADGLVARLAMEKSLDENVIEAYAVSKDSDYFIYNTGPATKGGYIPLDSLCVSSDPQTHITTITASVYTQSNIASDLSIRPHFLPLFASLTGNDYLQPKVFKEQITRTLAGKNIPSATSSNHARIKATAKFLEQYGAGSDTTGVGSNESQVRSVMEKVLDDRINYYSGDSDKEEKQELRLALEESMLQYTPSIPSDESKGPESLSEFSLTSSGLHKIKEALHSGRFSFKLMDVVCNNMFWCTPFLEDTDRESAWLASRELRRWIYGILAKNLMVESSTSRPMEVPAISLDVIEYVRRGDHLSAETVTGASDMELDEILKTAKAKENQKSKRRVSLMDVDVAQEELGDIDSTSCNDDQQGNADALGVGDHDNKSGMMDLASRTSLFLGILGADTAQVRALPKQFMVLAATLRYLVNALAHSKTRSSSNPIANFELVAFVASVLFSRERYHFESMASAETQNIPLDLASKATIGSTHMSPSTSNSSITAFPLDEAPPLMKRSVHLSTQYQHVLGTVSLLANALYLEDIIPSLATFFDGLLFQQTLALARGGTVLEQRMTHPESISMYYKVLAAIEEDFVDTGDIDVVVVFRAPSNKRVQQHDKRPSLGIFGPDMEPINQLTPPGSSADLLLKPSKAAGISKKSSGSSKKRGGASTSRNNNTNNNSREGSGRGGNGGNLFNVLSLGCEF
ncbi:hypothetical protein BGZ76_005080 [Entomortierella beljakovae]|nr:hypothetical protein BGZ76_005080 [Entomortierella beljakovae]